MTLTYTCCTKVEAHPRCATWRARVVSLSGAAILAGAVGCATGGGTAIPRGMPSLAEGSTPEPVRYEVVIPGARLETRNRLIRILSDSLFHVSGGDVATLTAYNLARLTKVRIEVVPAGRDSMRVALTGETYVGDAARSDSISGLPERWRLITASDPAALELRGLARALRTNRADRATSAGSGVGLALPPSAGQGQQPGDPGLAVLLATTLVGRAVSVCRNTTVPTGWLVLYWYRDTTRCANLADQRYPGEPNAMRLEREW